jgi:plastocyanin
MALLLAGLLVVFGGSAPCIAAVAAPGQTSARVHVIVIDKMQYGQMPTGVRPGDTVEWINHDIFEHSATARDGSFDLDLQPGASGRITVKSGTVGFFCKFHPDMVGTLTVP